MYIILILIFLNYIKRIIFCYLIISIKDISRLQPCIEYLQHALVALLRISMRASNALSPPISRSL